MGNRRVTRAQTLSKAVDEINMNNDRYNLWWTGPPENNIFNIGIKSKMLHLTGIILFIRDFSSTNFCYIVLYSNIFNIGKNI